MADGPLIDFELYYTTGGLVQVSNDVRRRILAELEASDLSLTDLSRIVNKAQSTLSVHLEKMIEDGLIAVHDDPSDSRRKMYSLVSLRFASSKKPSDESMDVLLGNLSHVVKSPEDVGGAIPHLLFLGLDALGLSVAPMSAMLGGLHATALDGSMSAQTLEETVDNARRYFSKVGMGDVSVFSMQPLTIVLKNEFAMTECAAKALGSYVVGFFSKVLAEAFDRNYCVTSSEVFGPECNYFRFTLEPTVRKPPIKI